MKYKSNQERTSEYFEKFNREIVLKFLVNNSSPLIIDIGSNVGTTLDEFKSWWPESEIHCFEPQEECWDELIHRASNYPPNSVFINKAAIGLLSGSAPEFYTHDINSGVSGFNKINLESKDSLHLSSLKSSESSDHLDAYIKSLNKPRTVDMVRMDNYFENFADRVIDLVKIDTQGYEDKVLQSFGDKLSKVKVLITELMFYDYYQRSLTFSDIEKYLLPAGFKLYDISHISKNPMNGRTDWVDLIYVNNQFEVLS